MGNYDIVIIGTGVTGLYLAYQLLKKDKNKKILIIEKENRFGGQLLTNTDNCDFGAMRLFPSIHPNVSKLVKDLKIPIEPMNLYTGDMILRNSKYSIYDDLIDTIGNYDINENDMNIIEKYQNMNTILEENYKAIMGDDIKDFDVNNVESRKNLIIKYNNYNNRNELITEPPYLSEDFYNYFIDTNSYSDAWNREMGLATGYLFQIAVIDAKDQYFFSEGAESIIKRLLEKIQKIGKNTTIIKNSKVYEIRKSSKNIKVYYIEDNKQKYIKTEKVITCIPFNLIQYIPVYIDDSIVKFESIKNIYSEFISSVNLFKIFLYFEDEDAFWGNFRGKTILSSSFNQMFFYSKNVILLYIVSEDAYIWETYFPTEGQIEFIDFNTIDSRLREKLLFEFNKVMNYYTSENIIPSKIAWKYWNNGLGFWKSNNKKLEIDKLIYPFGKKAGIDYLSVDLSFNQLWIQGSLEIVDDYINNNI